MTDRWHDWDPPTSPAANSRSYGVNPSSFYQQESNIDSLSSNEKNLGHILRLAAQNEIVQRRNEYTSVQRIKTEAYHDVTSFKVFPLQDLAMDHLQEMLKGYLGEKRSATQTQEDINCKRRKTEHISMHHPSDDMDGMKEKCTATYLAENDYLPPNDMNNKADRYRFLPELWSMEPRVFALETSSTGKRRYAVAQLGRFMQHYWRESDPQSRHYYELIREGCPCRLYFDLEFSKEHNPHITSSESEMLMTEFIEELCSEFQMVHNIQIDRTCIVDLDSSTENKFSRHLIIHLPNGELFADACAAGVFAKRFVGRLAEELATGVLAKRRATLARNLFVNNKVVEGAADCAKRGLNNKTCFVDLGVYTRNRLFRLMASMKYGKSALAALRIASANKFQFPDGFDNSKFYLKNKAPPGASNDDRPLNGSNLGPLPHKQRLPSSLSQDHDAFCAALDWEAHAKALAMTLVVPANSTKTPAPVLIEPNAGASCRKPTPIPSVYRQPKASSRICHGDSPIPKLDKLILEISKRGGTQGEIRAWSMEKDELGSRHMTYQMARNRWCENIGRPHKSNNIMWQIDLQRKVYWQQCHDEECRMMNFRGRSKELPEDVATEIDAFMLDQELAELDEDEIINRAKTQKHGVDLEFDDSVLDSALSGLDMSRFTPNRVSAKECS